MVEFNKDIPEEKKEKTVSSRKKRELDIVKDGETQFFKFKFRTAGGELPEKLKGRFTSVLIAEEWRDLYYTGQLNKA